jgi:Reverse transcriptase (RNA-dependent DNA polymerase)
MCTDYCYLNEQTIKNVYLLPLISEIIDKVGREKLFTKLDLCWGYNNVWIKEGDEWKAAFAMCCRSFEPLIMFFGMTNSPSTFQNMMNDIMKDLIDHGVVTVFIDGILIYMETNEGCDDIVQEVLQKLQENDLFLKAEKCIFKAWEIKFLGMIISPDRIKMDLIKINAIMSWLIPKHFKDVQSFSGLTNFYHCFVYNFSRVGNSMDTGKPVVFGLWGIQVQVWCLISSTCTCPPGVTGFHQYCKVGPISCYLVIVLLNLSIMSCGMLNPHEKHNCGDCGTMTDNSDQTQSTLLSLSTSLHHT